MTIPRSSAPLPGVVLSRITAEARAGAGGWARLAADVESSNEGAPYVVDGYVAAGYVTDVDSRNPAQLRATATLTGDVLSAFRPTDRVQMISFIHWYGPTSDFNPYQFKRGTSSIRFTMDGCTWSNEVPAQSVAGVGTLPVLSNLNTFPNNVRRSVMQVSAYIEVLTSAGRRRVQLLTDGLRDSVSEDHAGNSRRVVGTDGMVAYRKATATLLLPPGHGQLVTTVCRRILVAAGIPQGRIALSLPSNPRMYKELQLVDALAIEEVNRILEPHQHQLRCDEFNVIRTVHVGRNLAARPVFVFREQDVVAGGEPSFSGVTDGPTVVWVNGTRQVTREDGGHRTVEREVLAYKLTAPRRAAYRQNSDGSLSAVAGSAPAEAMILVGRVLRTQEHQGDTLISERVRTWGLYNPQTWRYKLNTDGSIAAQWNSLAYLYAGAVANDGNLAYLWPSERFELLSDILTTHIYLPDGVKEREVVRTGAWKIVRAAIKSRGSAATAWESVNFVNVYVLGNGQAISGLSEQFLESAAVTERVLVATDDRHYIQHEATTKGAYGRRPGVLYLYDDGETSSDAAESFIPNLESEETFYSGDKLSGTRARTVLHFEYGTLVAMEDYPSEDGWLPAVPISEDVIPPGFAFDDDAERAFAKAASRYESQRFKYKVSSAAVISDRGVIEERITHPYVETSEVAQSFGEFKVLEGFKYEAGWTVPCFPWARPGQRVYMLGRAFGVPTVDVFVREVEIAEQGDRTITGISGDVYLL